VKYARFGGVYLERRRAEEFKRVAGPSGEANVMVM
jgi:hypothetical protein